MQSTRPDKRAIGGIPIGLPFFEPFQTTHLQAASNIVHTNAAADKDVWTLVLYKSLIFGSPVYLKYGAVDGQKGLQTLVIASRIRLG